MATIVVVEDDAGIRETVTRMLDSLPVRIVALDRPHPDGDCPEWRNDVTLVMDIALGDTDAIAVLGDLAARRKLSKVILISGHPPETMQRVARVIGGMGHTVLGTLAKPFRRKALLDLLQPGPSPLARDASDGRPTPPPDLFEQALAHGWLEFWFQPQIDLSDGRVCGLEALARVRHPGEGIMSPAAFMPQLTPEGKARLTGAAIDAAAAMGEALRREHPGVSVSVNVFGGQLGDADLVGRLIAARNRLGDDAPLTVEVTETDAGDNLVAESFSARARLHGLRVSIDDFGAAYATFDRLRSISFTQLKMERAIVGEIASDLRARSICRASVELAHACDATAVAEGVETPEDLAVARAIGFDIAQGFLFARPMPHKELLRFIGDEGKRSRIRELVLGATVPDERAPAIAPTGSRSAPSAAAAPPEPGRYKLLLVEDDPLVADTICNLWPAGGADFTRAASLHDALRELRRSSAVEYDAFILDLNMPDGSGLELIANIRSVSAAPVIVISGSGTSESRAEAILAGVDDYVMKPFSVRELKARIVRSIGRGKPAPAADATPISKDVALDLAQGALVSGERREQLSHSEILLLRALKQAEGRVASRQVLSRTVLWRDYNKDDKSLDVCVSKLRKKIAAVDPRQTVRIASVRGLGYKLSTSD